MMGLVDADHVGTELAEQTDSAPRVSIRFRFLPWVLVALVILFVAVIRLRLLQIPLERDEGEYAYAGQLLLQGIPPYKLAFNMKFPGTYAAYALIMALFGQTIGGIHLGFLMLNAGTIVLVFLLGRRLLTTAAGVAAAAAYALLSVDPGVLGTQAHATHFVVAAALGGTLLLLRAVDTGRSAALFWSGLLYGIAVLMKQHGILFAVFAFLFLLWNHLARPRPPWTALRRKLALFCAGVTLPLALTGLALWKAGVFGRFWFWTVTYAREYAGENSLSDGIDAFSSNFYQVVRGDLAVWIAAAVGLMLIWWKKKNRPAAIFVTGLLIFSFLALCPGLYFRSHYFILMLPAVALLAGAAASCAGELLPGSRARHGVYGLFGIVLLFPVAVQRQFLFQLTPLQASRALYGPEPFQEAIQIGAWIRAHSANNSLVAVLGSEPEIPFYADRHSASGYMYVYPLMESQPFALTMQEELIHDVETARPEYVVVVGIVGSWTQERRSPTLIFDCWLAYNPQHYRKVGVIDLISSKHTEYRWDHVESYKFRSPNQVAVFKRI
jgi:Dolichyl-phosphate-mannose-protein mannosyltransferase